MKSYVADHIRGQARRLPRHWSQNQPRSGSDPLIAKAFHDLPADTVIDGEVVALDDHGRPDFHARQHFQASASRIHYFVFDLLIWNRRDLTKLPLSERREHLAGLKLRTTELDVSPGQNHRFRRTSPRKQRPAAWRFSTGRAAPIQLTPY